MKNIIRDKRYRVTDSKSIPTTVKLIGHGIRSGSTYLPLRNHVASIAATVPRKNYLMQMKAIYRDFLKRWRYVRDPFGTETVTISPKAVFNLVWGFNRGAGNGIGVGDCDDATVAIGSAAASCGFPVRIATTSPPGISGIGFTHVFPQVHIAGHGWITVDPVLEPNGTFGDIAPHGKIAVWDLNGNLIASSGIAIDILRRAFKMKGFRK